MIWWEAALLSHLASETRNLKNLVRWWQTDVLLWLDSYSLVWEGRSSLPSFPQWGYSFSSFLILLGRYHSSFLCSYSVDVQQFKKKKQTNNLAYFGSSITSGVLLQKMVLNRSINETSNRCYGWPWDDGPWPLILGKRLQLEENQNTMMKMWLIFWQGPKTKWSLI